MTDRSTCGWSLCGALLVVTGSAGCVDRARLDDTSRQLEAAKSASAQKDLQIAELQWSRAALGQELRLREAALLELASTRELERKIDELSSRLAPLEVRVERAEEALQQKAPPARDEENASKKPAPAAPRSIDADERTPRVDYTLVPRHGAATAAARSASRSIDEVIPYR